MDKQQIVDSIKSLEYIFVPYSQATRQPLIVCDEETFDDQVWVFDSEPEIQKFAKKYTEDKMLLSAYKIPQNKAQGFFSTLYSLGVNAVVFRSGQEEVQLELSDLASPPDLSKYKKGQEPLMNPTLQLSAIYYMQEMRRPVPEEEKRNLRELEEELNANLIRASYLMAGEPVDENNIRLPFIKNDKGEVYQPVFTDVYEYYKFAGRKKYRVLKIPFAQLQKHLLENSNGFVINPQGFNLLLQKRQMENKGEESR